MYDMYGYIDVILRRNMNLKNVPSSTQATLVARYPYIHRLCIFQEVHSIERHRDQLTQGSSSYWSTSPSSTFPHPTAWLLPRRPEITWNTACLSHRRSSLSRVIGESPASVPMPGGTITEPSRFGFFPAMPVPLPSPVHFSDWGS